MYARTVKRVVLTCFLTAVFSAALVVLSSGLIETLASQEAEFLESVRVGQLSEIAPEITDGTSAKELPLTSFVELVSNNSTQSKIGKYDALAAYGTLVGPQLSSSELDSYWNEMNIAFDAEEFNEEDYNALARSIAVGQILETTSSEETSRLEVLQSYNKMLRTAWSSYSLE